MNTVEVDMHNIHQNVPSVSEERLDNDHTEDSSLEWEESWVWIYLDRLQKAYQ